MCIGLETLSVFHFHHRYTKLHCMEYETTGCSGEALAGIPLPIIIKRGRKTARDWKITQITAFLTQSAFADQRQDPV